MSSTSKIVLVFVTVAQNSFLNHLNDKLPGNEKLETFRIALKFDKGGT